MRERDTERETEPKIGWENLRGIGGRGLRSNTLYEILKGLVKTYFFKEGFFPKAIFL